MDFLRHSSSMPLKWLIFYRVEGRCVSQYAQMLRDKPPGFLAAQLQYAMEVVNFVERTQEQRACVSIAQVSECCTP